MIIRILLLIMLLAAPVYAQNDIVSVGLRAVDDFHTTTTELMGGLKGKKAVKSFSKSALKEREKTTSEIRSLRWLEKPGMRRFNIVYEKVDNYFKGQVSSIKALEEELGGKDKARLEKIIKKLKELRGQKLKELDEAVKFETFERKKEKPVPLIDRSPFEKGPGKDEGIWYR
ncbi:MAG: hypothetical protein ACE5EB_00585 [Thermodesulfobacteriota bacterium]